MKKVFKILFWVVGIVALLVVAFVIYVSLSWDKKFEAEYPQIQSTTDSAAIARGKYLVYGPAHCVACHVPNDQFEAVDRGEQLPLIGGGLISFEIGNFRTKNLTPDVETGIGGLSDQEIARIMRNSVGHDGRLIFPFMPFQDMCDADLAAIISFLRSQPPVKNKVEPTDYTFLGKAVIALGLIKPVGPTSTPAANVSIDSTAVYGEYLVYSVANCVGCHSPRDLTNGDFIGPKLSGGMAMLEPNQHTYVSPNLTPDPATGVMASWTEEAFISRMKAGRVVEGSPMPWGNFAQMNELELKAIYRYLMTLDPVKNRVERTDYGPGEYPPSE
ncbi:mono/diheme cytochrome c family protein [Algoriphagus boseongensis]|uniref:Mono/diheme cytochrome c family protein n=1 Tax=Algoriphagus boseongensis TaxID=1442587 RepID=A0A4R6T3X0_9BACT|nr:c-type cytochrome [Algoriphagus boseongensis]TDQ16357.1 mono/diheme cytochrome c family protein [Algoriphagus boseongensis]